MTVETLRNILNLLPADKEVYIEQGMDSDYATIHNVKELNLIFFESEIEDENIDAVVINFT